MVSNHFRMPIAEVPVNWKDVDGNFSLSLMEITLIVVIFS